MKPKLKVKNQVSRPSDDPNYWKPRRSGPNGMYYCSPGCSSGDDRCTRAAYDEAVAKAKALAAELTAKSTKAGKWKPQVWENMGWHWCVVAPGGYVLIYPPKQSGDTWSAYINDRGDGQSGARWVEHGKTPKSALSRAFALLVLEAGKVNRALENAQGLKL